MALTKVKANNITLTTAAASSNDTTPATTQYVTTAINNLIDGAPATLNTLDEIAAALNDDAALNTTLTNAIAAKLPLAGGTMTGNLRGTSFSVGAADAGEALNILDGGHTGQGAANTVSLASFAESASGNSAGLWIGAMTNENTAVLGSRTSSGNFAFQTYDGSAWVERMRINSSGKVGIGDTSPGYILEISDENATNHYSNRRITIKSVNHGENVGVRFDAEDSGGTNRSAGYYFQPMDATVADSYLSLAGNDGATHMAVTSSGKVGIGLTAPAAPLHIQFSNNDGGVGGHLIKNTNTGTTSNFASLSTQAVNGTIQGTFGSAHYSTWGNAIVFAGSQTNHPFKILTNNAVRATFDTSGNVGIGTDSITSGVKLEVTGGKIYVPGHNIQAQTALMGGFTNYKWKEQPLNNSATAPSANKSAAFVGSNASSTGIVLQRDSVGNTFPDFAITESGYIYANNNITMQNGGNDSADYRSGAPGYVNWGSKIENHGWKNWSGTGNYTARLYTPIGHNEGNMFQLEIDVFGYSTGGAAQRYIGGGYAYSGSSLIAHGTVALSGSLNHRLTTATHPNFNTTVVVFDIGYSSNNGTSYYNHMRWRYQGWNGKRAEDFVWAHVTT